MLVLHTVLLVAILGFLFQNAQCLSLDFEIVDMYIPNDGCEVFVQQSDHVLIEFDIFLQNNTIAASVNQPDQLFYIQIDGSENNVNKGIKGMCLGATRKLTWQNAATADFSPIFLQKSKFAELVNEQISIVIRANSITTVEDYAIFDAFKADNTTTILELIDQHKGINAIDRWGQTTLMIATMDQKYTEFAALMNARRPSVDVNKAKPSGATAIFYAINHAHPMMVQALLRRGADPNMSMKSKDALGNTPLHIACMLEKPKHALLLLEYGANPYAINQYGRTPIQLLPDNSVRAIRLQFQKMFEDAAKKWNAIAVDGELPRAPIPFIHDL